jgi:hypothetical protein
MRRAVLAITIAATACVEWSDSAALMGTCEGDGEQCDATLRVRAWMREHVDEYDDRDIRVEWAQKIDGVTFAPRSVLVTSDRALCHELLHAHLWRERRDPCSSHSDRCGWDAAIERACKDNL